MRKHPGLFFRFGALCLLMAGALFFAFPARAELLLFATAADCESAPLASWDMESPHAAVLQKAGSAAQKSATEALKQAGVEDVVFLGLTGIAEKNRNLDTMKKKWDTEENRARIASLLRQAKDEGIIYYGSTEEEHSFLGEFADLCAVAAGDPTCRRKKKQEDEYVHRVERLTDGKTGETRAVSPANTAWREAWEDGAKYDLSALPETDSEGFLAGDEYVLEDEDQGLWVYLSDTLRVVITKHKMDRFSWFEADILRRPEGETLHIVESLNGLGNKPDLVAQENNLVFGINTDYYQVRVNAKKKVGLIIRNGEVIRESPGATKGTGLPPLDTLLLDGEGGFRVDISGELDSEKALALGARDVLAFGPLLIRDGLLRMLIVSTHYKQEPRTAIGCLGENHYLAVVAEGRLSYAPGMTLDQLGQLMAARGCTDAINLDGGHTSALIFMGKRLNKIGSLGGGGTTGPRNMAELLGIGTHHQTVNTEE